MTKFAYSLCLAAALLALGACNQPVAHGEGDGDGGGVPPATASDAASPAAGTADLSSVSPMAQKPGLWQITQTLPNMPNAAIATKICVDAGMGEKMATYGMNNKVSDTDCSNKSVVRTATGADIAMTCTSKERTTNMKMHVERVSDVEFKQTMDATFTPATSGHDSMSMTMKGKWLGACPAGMKGGDISVDKGGNVANMYDAMAKLKTQHGN